MARETYTSFGDEDQWLTYAKQVGLQPDSSGHYVFHLGNVVDWSRLRVVDACVAQRTC